MIKALVFDAYGTLYDVQSVAAVIDAAFPGHGSYITQVWRLKQLEYSWLRTLMGRYADFWTVTRESLSYTLTTLGLVPDERLFEDVAEAYNRLAPYHDTDAALTALAGFRLAVFSNGSPEMLDALVRNSGFGRHFEAVISVDERRAFKPERRVYELVEERLDLKRDEIAFVSSNGFDVAGAKSFGFRVARVERVAPSELTREIALDAGIGPSTMFKSLRTQAEILGVEPDVTVGSLRELAAIQEQL